jgi:sigma-54 dependent transcriptional regulator, acetoin dehydrogenase operon transcriptional activator AcoR
MLILRTPGANVWKRYVNGESIERTKTGRLLYGHWERSREQGVDPKGSAHPEGVTGGDLAVRRDRAQDAIAEGAPLLNQVSAALSDRHAIAVLTDQDGVILLQRGGGRFESTAAKVRLVEGARWNEGSRGTNAIGTALAHGGPVAVVGAAHYEKTNHGLFCYAAPVKDPLGRIVALLDVTGKLADNDATLALSVMATATAVERILNARAYSQAVPGGLRLLEGMLDRCAVGAIVIEHPGIVRMMNDKAAVLLGVTPSRTVGRTSEAITGYPFATLRDEALHPRGRALRIEGERLTAYAEAEPLTFGSGEPFAVLLYLEPEVPFALPKDRDSSSIDVTAKLPSLRGSDPQFALVRKAAERLARSGDPFVLLGDHGTGKKRVARSVHGASERRNDPFLVLTASAEDESPDALSIRLFGRGGKRGAALIGQLEAAAGGTLYVDEVQKLPKDLQSTLGEAIKNQAFRRLGETTQRQLQARLIFASTMRVKDLLTSVAPELQEVMGQNLLTIPRVRDRGDKVELALGALLEGEHSSNDPWELDDEARAFIANHPWEGNLAELVFVMHEAKSSAGGSGLVGSRELRVALGRWNARGTLS